MDLRQDIGQDVALCQLCEDIDVLLTQVVHVVRVALEGVVNRDDFEGLIVQHGFDDL